MIEEIENGKWLAKCDICSWSKTEENEEFARRSYSEHMNKVHKKEGSETMEGAPISPRKKPPNIPEPIAPQGRREEQK
jgi:hypothetical protein